MKYLVSFTINIQKNLTRKLPKMIKAAILGEPHNKRMQTDQNGRHAPILAADAERYVLPESFITLWNFLKK